MARFFDFLLSDLNCLFSKLCSFMVSDHERHLTFRSQFFHVCFNTNRAFKMTFGDLRSKPLAGEDTSENNIPLARYPTGRLRTR